MISPYFKLLMPLQCLCCPTARSGLYSAFYDLERFPPASHFDVFYRGDGVWRTWELGCKIKHGMPVPHDHELRRLYYRQSPSRKEDDDIPMGEFKRLDTGSMCQLPLAELSCPECTSKPCYSCVVLLGQDDLSGTIFGLSSRVHSCVYLQCCLLSADICFRITPSNADQTRVWP